LIIIIIMYLHTLWWYILKHILDKGKVINWWLMCKELRSCSVVVSVPMWIRFIVLCFHLALYLCSFDEILWVSLGV